MSQNTHDPVSYRHEAPAEQSVAMREKPTLRLWQVEADLAVWTETAEGESVPEELQSEFAAKLAEASERAVAKRERCIEFIIAAEKEIEACKEREEGARARRKQIESGLKKFRAYVADIVRQHGTQKPGQKTYTLACPLGVLRAQQNAPAVVISDESEIPLEFKKAVVTFNSADEWAWVVHIMRSYDFEPEPGRVDVRLETMVSRIKEAQDAGVDVPGADREPQGEWSLRTK